MGCVSALERPALRTLPTVEHLVAGADWTSIASALDLPNESLGAATRQSGSRALLRIQDGCDEHCTFCATTHARGANRSRPSHELLSEARVLSATYEEIVLTGVHIGTYGNDVQSTLGALVQSLVAELPATRFRLSSVEATEVDDTLFSLFASPQHLVPHLHAPLQSGSDRVLRRMGRHWYTAATYSSAVNRLVGERQVFALGADIIAGFPGESEEDHQETLEVVRSLPFTYLHVFPFSLRPGTPAERLPNHVPGDVIARRAAELRRLGNEKAQAYRRQRMGSTADVVSLGGESRRGLTEDYLTVTIDGPAVGRGQRVRAVLGGDADDLTAFAIT